MDKEGYVIYLIETHMLWYNIRDTEDCDKKKSAEDLGFGKYKNHCPLCNYVKETFGSLDIERCMSDCPINSWGPTIAPWLYDEAPCESVKESPYSRYIKTTSKTMKRAAATDMVRLVNRRLHEILTLRPTKAKYTDRSEKIVHWASSQGLDIRCKVWDGDHSSIGALSDSSLTTFVKDVCQDILFPYRTHESPYSEAKAEIRIDEEGKKRRFRIKDRTAIIKQLCDEGYEMHTDGSWVYNPPPDSVGKNYIFNKNMFRHCGEEIPPELMRIVDSNGLINYESWCWDLSWIEEV